MERLGFRLRNRPRNFWTEIARSFFRVRTRKSPIRCFVPDRGHSLRMSPCPSGPNRHFPWVFRDIGQKPNVRFYQLKVAVALQSKRARLDSPGHVRDMSGFVPAPCMSSPTTRRPRYRESAPRTPERASPARCGSLSTSQGPKCSDGCTRGDSEIRGSRKSAQQLRSVGLYRMTRVRPPADRLGPQNGTHDTFGSVEAARRCIDRLVDQARRIGGTYGTRQQSAGHVGGRDQSGA